MLNLKQSFILFLILSITIYGVKGQREYEELTTPGSSQVFKLPFMSDLTNYLKTFTGQASGGGNPLKSFLDSLSISSNNDGPDLLPPDPAVRKSSANPSDSMSSKVASDPKTLESLLRMINPGNAVANNNDLRSIMEVPANMLKAAVTVPASLTKTGTRTLDRAADTLIEATSATTKMVESLTGAPPASKKEDENAYYEVARPEEPFSTRRPTYYGKECSFRLACEVGRFLKPFSGPFRDIIQTNRTVQDLQNRYSRAFSYGMLKGECQPYYCVFLQFLGGPRQIVGGTTDMVNRLVNPDLYDRT